MRIRKFPPKKAITVNWTYKEDYDFISYKGYMKAYGKFREP